MLIIQVYGSGLLPSENTEGDDVDYQHPDHYQSDLGSQLIEMLSLDDNHTETVDDRCEG